MNEEEKINILIDMSSITKGTMIKAGPFVYRYVGHREGQGLQMIQVGLKDEREYWKEDK